MEQYSYTSLSANGEPDTIRVIEILPGSGVDMVYCNIKHVQLASNPNYEALSYCWGDPTPNHYVYCDGKPLAIATNLYLALHRLRHRSETRTLWADAISINQQDIDERSQQVRLMRQIYEKAAQVTLWLGEEANNSQLGLALVPQLVEAYKKWDASGDTRGIGELGTSNLRQVYNLPAGTDLAWAAFFAILKRPWFSRGWVIQEAAVAQSITIYCGRAIFPFDDFMKAFVFSDVIGLALSFDATNFRRLVRIGLSRQAFKGRVSRNLLSILLPHRLALTTDPRDKIFALCGLADNAGPEGLDVCIDYHLPVEKVYRDLAIKMLTWERNLDILSVPRIDRFSDSPAWIPDWSRPVEVPSLIGSDYNVWSPSRYCASRATKCSPEFTQGGRLLGLAGFVFDEIAEAGETQPLKTGNDDAFSPTNQLLEEFEERKRYMNWRSIAGLLTKKKYVTGEDLEDAYWQVLIAGYNPGEVTAADRERIKAHYLTWTRHSLRFAYLRFLPSPLFEWALGFTMLVSVFWLILRLLMCLPLVATPSEFKQMMVCVATRKLVRTKKGYIGLASDAVRVNDSVVLCEGGKLPLVVREDGQVQRLVSDCYIHGIVHGEAFEEGKCGRMLFI